MLHIIFSFYMQYVDTSRPRKIIDMIGFLLRSILAERERF